MQAVNETNDEFLRRTDRLMSHLRINIGDLTDILDLSRASIFRYRSGKSKVSPKAWRRLAAAETKAGIPTPLLEKMSLLSEEGASNEQVFAHLLKNMELNENLDSQFAVLVGPKLVGSSVMISWNLFESEVRKFLKELRTGNTDPENIRTRISDIYKGLRAFRYQLRQLVEMLPDD